MLVRWALRTTEQDVGQTRDGTDVLRMTANMKVFMLHCCMMISKINCASDALITDFYGKKSCQYTVW